MAKRFSSVMSVLLAAMLLLGISAFATEPMKWVNVGGDPCNPKAGCTLLWALENTKWPGEVQVGLVAKVKGTPPETIAITSGLGGAKGPAFSGWMTWGKVKPKFEPNVIAAWPDGQYHPASHWSFDLVDVRYHLIKVRACGNWGGWTEVLPKVVTAPPKVAEVTVAPPPKRSDDMQYGVLPVVSCIN